MMRKEIRQSLENLKNQMIEITEHLTMEEREEFYNEINDWTYGEYEKSLIDAEPEMQDYEEA